MIRSRTDNLLRPLHPTRSSAIVAGLALCWSLALLPRDTQAAIDPVRQAEQQRVEMIEQASRCVVSILAPGEAGGGSGVIITPDGYGLTNFHVIMTMLESRRGLAGLSDGQTYPLEVLGIAPTGDLAMFRLSGRDQFDAAPLGDSDALRVGDPVVALGNPFMLAEDYTPTATFGIISGLNRYQHGADARSLVYTDCIQVDASINPGNSGGPLFDLQGRVVGINGRASFQKHDALRQRVNVGVAYAISINQVKRFIPALKEGYLVEHGTLGATVADTPDGVRFDNVLTDSPADRIGIARGDELMAFDGRPITSANAFGNLLGIYPAGWPVTVTFRRGGQESPREVSLDPLPLPKAIPWAKADPAWIRSVAKGTVPTTLPYDVTALAHPNAAVRAGDDPDRRAARPPMPGALAAAMPCVVKIIGGQIGTQQGYATGLIVSPDGEIVTALASLLEASDLRVVTSDGRLHRAQVVHRDPYRQLALLKTGSGVFSEAAPRDPPSPMPPPRAVHIDEALQPAIGDGVFVIGNPFKIADGDEPCSVTHGILSGRIRLDARRPGQGAAVAFHGNVWIMDAMSSNPGSPGSAVFDLQGRWIGLIGEVVESRLTNTALNYAYPVSEVAAFLHEARTPATAPAETPSASAAPGYHGIRLSRFGFRQRLPFVDSVAPDSPAARAGIQSGDLIINANQRSIPRAQAFDELCARLGVGEFMTLTVKRGDDLLTVRFALEEAPP